MSIEFLYFLKRERDISIKPMFSGGKTTFRCTPALSVGITYVKSYLQRIHRTPLSWRYVCTSPMDGFECTAL